MLRSEADIQGSKTYAILKDNKLWSWSDKNKNGMIIDLTDTQSQATGGQKNSDDIIGEVEKTSKTANKQLFLTQYSIRRRISNSKTWGKCLKTLGQRSNPNRPSGSYLSMFAISQ